MVSKVKSERQGKHLTTHFRHLCSLHIYVHRPLQIAAKFDMRTSLEECIPQDSHFQEEPPSAYLQKCMFISLFSCLVFISITFLKVQLPKKKGIGKKHNLHNQMHTKRRNRVHTRVDPKCCNLWIKIPNFNCLPDCS